MIGVRIGGFFPFASDEEKKQFAKVIELAVQFSELPEFIEIEVEAVTFTDVVTKRWDVLIAFGGNVNLMDNDQVFVFQLDIWRDSIHEIAAKLMNVSNLLNVSMITLDPIADSPLAFATVGHEYDIQILQTLIATKSIETPLNYDSSVSKVVIISEDDEAFIQTVFYRLAKMRDSAQISSNDFPSTIIVATSECVKIFVANDICDADCVKKVKEISNFVCLDYSTLDEHEDWLNDIWNPATRSDVDDWSGENMNFMVPVVWDAVQWPIQALNAFEKSGSPVVVGTTIPYEKLEDIILDFPYEGLAMSADSPPEVVFHTPSLNELKTSVSVSKTMTISEAKFLLCGSNDCELPTDYWIGSPYFWFLDYPYFAAVLLVTFIFLLVLKTKKNMFRLGICSKSDCLVICCASYVICGVNLVFGLETFGLGHSVYKCLFRSFLAPSSHLFFVTFLCLSLYDFCGILLNRQLVTAEQSGTFRKIMKSLIVMIVGLMIGGTYNWIHGMTYDFILGYKIGDHMQKHWMCSAALDFSLQTKYLNMAYAFCQMVMLAIYLNFNTNRVMKGLKESTLGGRLIHIKYYNRLGMIFFLCFAVHIVSLIFLPTCEENGKCPSSMSFRWIHDYSPCQDLLFIVLGSLPSIGHELFFSYAQNRKIDNSEKKSSKLSRSNPKKRPALSSNPKEIEALEWGARTKAGIERIEIDKALTEHIRLDDPFLNDENDILTRTVGSTKSRRRSLQVLSSSSSRRFRKFHNDMRESLSNRYSAYSNNNILCTKSNRSSGVESGRGDNLPSLASNVDYKKNGDLNNIILPSNKPPLVARNGDPTSSYNSKVAYPKNKSPFVSPILSPFNRGGRKVSSNSNGTGITNNSINGPNNNNNENPNGTSNRNLNFIKNSSSSSSSFYNRISSNSSGVGTRSFNNKYISPSLVIPKAKDKSNSPQSQLKQQQQQQQQPSDEDSKDSSNVSGRTNSHVSQFILSNENNIRVSSQRSPEIIIRVNSRIASEQLPSNIPPLILPRTRDENRIASDQSHMRFLSMGYDSNRNNNDKSRSRVSSDQGYGANRIKNNNGVDKSRVSSDQGHNANRIKNNNGVDKRYSRVSSDQGPSTLLSRMPAIRNDNNEKFKTSAALVNNNGLSKRGPSRLRCSSFDVDILSRDSEMRDTIDDMASQMIRKAKKVAQNSSKMKVEPQEKKEESSSVETANKSDQQTDKRQAHNNFFASLGFGNNSRKNEKDGKNYKLLKRKMSKRVSDSIISGGYWNKEPTGKASNLDSASFDEEGLEQLLKRTMNESSNSAEKKCPKPAKDDESFVERMDQISQQFLGMSNNFDDKIIGNMANEITSASVAANDFGMEFGALRSISQAEPMDLVTSWWGSLESFQDELFSRDKTAIEAIAVFLRVSGSVLQQRFRSQDRLVVKLTRLLHEKMDEYEVLAVRASRVKKQSLKNKYRVRPENVETITL